MGRALIRCAAARADVTVTAAVEQSGHADVGVDAGVVACGKAIGAAIVDDIRAVSTADVAVDFSYHEAVPSHIRAAADSGKAMVLGATGLSEEESAAVRGAAASVPIVWAPNMSLAMNVLFKLVADAGSALGMDYDAEIVEMHHRHKKDAPSGTALELARHLAESRGQDLGAAATVGRDGEVGERPQGEIGLHAVRGGDVVGDHHVILAGDGERLELSHRASSRDAFANGALHAAVWVHGRNPGLYSMRDVLGL